MTFFGRKRIILVDEKYGQIQKISEFWDEMRASYPDEKLLGLGVHWDHKEFDYYIGKIDESLTEGLKAVDLPDENWIEFSCKIDDGEIERMYRKIYEQGKLDYEIESMENGIFTAKVHFAKNGGKNR